MQYGKAADTVHLEHLRHEVLWRHSKRPQRRSRPGLVASPGGGEKKEVGACPLGDPTSRALAGQVLLTSFRHASLANRRRPVFLSLGWLRIRYRGTSARALLEAEHQLRTR